MFSYSRAADTRLSRTSSTNIQPLAKKVSNARAAAEALFAPKETYHENNKGGGRTPRVLPCLVSQSHDELRLAQLERENELLVKHRHRAVRVEFEYPVRRPAEPSSLFTAVPSRSMYRRRPGTFPVFSKL